MYSNNLQHQWGSENAFPPSGSNTYQGGAKEASMKSNAIDNAFADLTAVVVNQVDPQSKTQLAAKLKQETSTRPTRAAPTMNKPPGIQQRSSSFHQQNQQQQAFQPAPQPFQQQNHRASFDENVYYSPTPSFAQQQSPPRNPFEVSEMSNNTVQQYQQHNYQLHQYSSYQQPHQFESYQKSPSPPIVPNYTVQHTGYGSQETFLDPFGGSTPPSHGSHNHQVPFPAQQQPSPSYPSPSMYQPSADRRSSSFGIEQGMYEYSQRPTVSQAAALEVSSSFDPFFGPDDSQSTITTSTTTSQTTEKKATEEEEDFASGRKSETSDDSDDDSDLDDEASAGDVEQFDESAVAHVIPTTFPDEAALKTFLLAPIDSSKLVKCIIMFDKTEKVWTFTNQSNGVRLMTAFKRKDGLKRLTTQMQFSINYSSRAIEEVDLKGKSRFGSWKSFSSKSEKDTYVAKIKSNVHGSNFEVFDTGLNPSKAVGAMHARRELGAIKFEKATMDSFRRKVRACVPAMGHNYRPLSKKEQMFERLAQGDGTVFPLVNHVPGKPMVLPKLSDFHGMALSSSVKNMILHNPIEADAEPIYVFGKTGRDMFNCYFREPISPVMAFAMGLASIGSYVNPKA